MEVLQSLTSSIWSEGIVALGETAGFKELEPTELKTAPAASSDLLCAPCSQVSSELALE